MHKYLSVSISCGIILITLSPFWGCRDNNNPTSPITDQIPEGAIWNKETLRQVYPPSGFTTVVGWLQAATLSKTQQGEVARLTIDYMKLIERRADGSEYIVSEEYYDVNQPYLEEAGLYDRSPSWFATDNSTPLYNSAIKDGFLILDASATPNNILHWWTKRVYCDSRSRFFLEVSVKIEGKVGLQLGSDYKIGLAGLDGYESWISDWYGDTEGRFITIRAPLH
jgi:hypothetical protein